MTDPSRAQNSIGNHIRRLRFEHNEMTQEALAQAVGITRQTVIALEAERYAPSLDLAMKIAEVFDQKVDAVFFRRTPVSNSTTTQS
jgi:putative transcriptional regulator